MAELPVGQTIETAESVLAVENLLPGRHVFELRVEDESANLSQPARVVVIVRSSSPRVTSFDPEFGHSGQRVVLWVTGVVSADFATDHEVLFNGARARIVGGSTRTLHAIVPEGAGSGPVTLITARGQGVSDVPFHIPRRRLLLLPGAHSPCFAGDSASLGALVGGPNGDRIAVWNLDGIASSAAPITPGSAAPAFASTRPDQLVDLGGPASRLSWLDSRGVSGFLAWQPGSIVAHLVAPGDSRPVNLPLPGAAVDIRTPDAGPGTGAAGLFGGTGGRNMLARFDDVQRGWTPVAAAEAIRIALSPDGSRMVASRPDGTLERIDLPRGDTVETFPPAPGGGNGRLFIGNAGEIWRVGSAPPRVTLARAGRMVGLDLGLEAESAAVPGPGDPLFAAGEGRDRLLAVRAAGPTEDQNHLFGRALNLPAAVAGGHALALAPDGVHLAVLHRDAQSISFFNARTLERTVTLPLALLGGTSFGGDGKTPTQAASADGSLFAFAMDSGVSVLESGSVVV